MKSSPTMSQLFVADTNGGDGNAGDAGLADQPRRSLGATQMSRGMGGAPAQPAPPMPLAGIKSRHFSAGDHDSARAVTANHLKHL